MSSTEVQTVTPGAEKAKLAGAVLLAAGGVVAYYLLTKQGALAQWGSLIGLLLAGALLFFVSEQGKSLIAYGRDSWREARKVVWPTRKESLQMTGYVFAFVVVMALFLWLTDKSLEWVLYDLLLGWKR
ncbi:MAG: preprotein translocase subunit SecE [Burkholderiales bacterium]|uniref:preprotein translocase subunit SecE n=1 Tax=Inhella sp. TaxID=1921806 RepID=UPI001AC31A5C|nr:preprotein translocase subunit SecE [Burkholderiales bacterium]